MYLRSNNKQPLASDYRAFMQSTHQTKQQKRYTQTGVDLVLSFVQVSIECHINFKWIDAIYQESGSEKVRSREPVNRAHRKLMNEYWKLTSGKESTLKMSKLKRKPNFNKTYAMDRVFTKTKSHSNGFTQSSQIGQN